MQPAKQNILPDFSYINRGEDLMHVPDVVWSEVLIRNKTAHMSREESKRKINAYHSDAIPYSFQNSCHNNDKILS